MRLQELVDVFGLDIFKLQPEAQAENQHVLYESYDLRIKLNLKKQFACS